MDDVLSISCSWHCLALKIDGSLWAWGDNYYGELGCGNPFTAKPVPIHTQSEQIWNINGCVTDGLATNLNTKCSFKFEIKELDKSTITNFDGTFILANVPVSLKGYTIKISKPGYLSRQLDNIIVADSDVNLGSKDSPIELWAGDINQDDCINMADVVGIAKYFNTNSDDQSFENPFKYDMDLNKDFSINMIDIFMIAKH